MRAKYLKNVILQVRFPSNLPVEAKDFLRSLLIKDPQRRLGGGPNDSKEVMSHPFYFNIDWDMIYRKQVRICVSLKNEFTFFILE